MKIFTTIPTDLPPTALALGNFDGVHLGHQALLRHLKTLASHTTLVTFTNHPYEVLRPTHVPTPLCTLEEKLHLLEPFALDVVITLPFTPALAQLTYEEFLAPFPLTHLLIGLGDALGKNRAGNFEALTLLGKIRGFTVDTMTKTHLDGGPISSRRIREALASGHLTLAQKLLGRNIRNPL